MPQPELFPCDRIQNGTATLKGSLAVSYKSPTPTIPSPHRELWYLTKGGEKICSHESLCMNRHGSCIHNGQNLGAIKMSLSRCLGNHNTPRQRSISQPQKGNELLSQKKTQRRLNAHDQVKEANMKRLHTVIPTI